MQLVQVQVNNDGFSRVVKSEILPSHSGKRKCFQSVLKLPRFQFSPIKINSLPGDYLAMAWPQAGFNGQVGSEPQFCSWRTATRKLKFQHSLGRVLKKNTEPEEEQQHTVLVTSN